MLHDAIESNDPRRLFEAFREEALSLGYDRAAYVNFAALGHDGETPPATITYAPEWRAHYDANGYLDKDILFPLALTNRSPIRWEFVRANCELSPIQERIFDEADDSGHRFGITFPFHNPSGPAATVSVATTGTDKDVAGAELRLLGLAAQFHALYDALIHAPNFIGPPPRIPPREREVLHWVAAGKSSWEISVITGLKPNSVDTYVKRSMRRLNVHSRIAAVLVAGRLGMLNL